MGLDIGQGCSNSAIVIMPDPTVVPDVACDV
jgi:hypothetical protein